MVSHRYIEIDGIPIPEEDLFKWARWFETADRTVARDHVGDFEVSTVFLGLDHNFGMIGPPLLYETMLFTKDGDSLDEQYRYPTREFALENHKKIVARLKKERA